MKNKSPEPATAKNFAYPYGHLLVSGELNISGQAKTGVKTSKGRFNPRPDQHIFIRTSGNAHKNIAERHLMDIPSGIYQDGLRVINGVGVLKAVRELTEKEKYELFCKFDCLTPADRTRRLFEGTEEVVLWEPDIDLPLRWGLFFEDLRPFEKPVPLEIAPGPVNFVNVERSKLLDQALDGVGLSWSDMLSSR